MPSTSETILIDVSFETHDLEARAAGVRAELAALKTANKELKKDVEAMTETSSESARQLALNEEAIKMDQAALKTLDAQIVDATKTSTDYGDSLNEMRAELTSLQRSYAALSKAERDSAQGTELLQHITELRGEVGNLEASMGQNQRNVGNYTSSIEAALKKMGQAGGVSLKGLTTSVKSFGKVFVTYPLNVITAILAAVLVVIQGVTDAFKKNDAAMTALQSAFASFQPILSLVEDIFQRLVGVIAKIVEGIAKLASSLIGKLVPGYTAAAEAARELVRAQDELEDRERDYEVKSAERAAKISRLRNEAQDKDKSLETRRAALVEALELEKEDLEEQKNIANERLRIAQEQAQANRDTSDETKNRIAELQAAVYNAEKNYEDGTRRLRSQLQSFDEAERNSAAAAMKAAADRRKAAEEAARAEVEAFREEVEALNKRAEEAAMEDVQLRLNVVRRGSEEEFALRMKYIDMQRARELQNTDLLASERANIEEKYRQQEEQAERTRAAGRREELLNEMRTFLEEQNSLTEEMGASAETRALQRQMQEAENYLNYLQALDEEKRAILFPEEGSFASEIEKTNERIRLSSANLAASEERDIQRMVRAWQTFTSSVSKSTQQMMSSMGDLVGENEKTAALQASVQMAEILTSEALALARGTAASQTLPFPANIAALVTTIATITSQFATVYKTFSESGFAGGGIVAGNAYRGDRLTARVNSGEMILNTAQQARLFELANSPQGGATGGFDYETLTASLTEAVAAQPAPIMDYKEFTTFQRRTALYKEYANIRK